MKNLKFFLLLIAALAAGPLTAQKQGQALIDSLLRELPNAKGDTNRVVLLNSLSFAFTNINPDSGTIYGQQGLDLAAKLEWENGIALANDVLGVNYQSKSDYSHALECFWKALKIDEEIKNKESLAHVFGNIGIVYASQGDYDEALEYFLKDLKIDEEMADKIGIEQVYGNIGNVYRIQSDYPKALDYYFKALKMAEELGDKNNLADVTENIGNVYNSESDYPKALDYFFKALKTDEELGNKNWIAGVSGNIGSVYMRESNYPKALEYYFNALKIFDEIGDKNDIASLAGNIGEAYNAQKKYTMAIEYEQKALNMAREIGDKYDIAYNLCNIGGCFLSMIKDKSSQAEASVTNTNELSIEKDKPIGAIPSGRSALLRNSIDYLQQGLAISKGIHTPELLQSCYKNLAEAYGLSGDYKRALESYKNFTDIKDSVFSKENSEKILKMDMKYEYDKKTAEAEKIALLKLQRQRAYNYMGISGILLLLGFSFFIAKERRKSEKERKKSDALLLNILPAEVAHELKINGATKARQFDNVTVMFTDFVNFTQAVEHMFSQSLIDELHACFKVFDEITTKYSIEKIKTIGDAYLAVAGLPTADPKHAENIVNAAIEINAFMRDRLSKLGTNTFEIRIGIHSGSVVAGIVGVKKFAYDIWGDTVNTAARMEQNSEAGRINISQTTYELVKDKFICGYRGEIEAKGKGEMKMYYVV